MHDESGAKFERLITYTGGSGSSLPLVGAVECMPRQQWGVLVARKSTELSFAARGDLSFDVKRYSATLWK